jgi:phosphatidylinositol alpha-1,6-mannosyltransferase
VVAPDYARQTGDDDRSLPFEVIRFRGGLHSMRDLPRKIMLARRRVRGDRYDIVHAADWPFFIPVALSRWRTPARVLMTVHGTEINETQTRLKRIAIRGAGVFGPRTEVVANSRFTETLFRERFAVDPRRSARSISAYRNSGSVRQGNAGRFGWPIGWQKTGW